MKLALFLPLLLLGACATQPSHDDTPETALEVVHDFYRHYFEGLRRPGKHPQMPGSKRWRELTQENARICRQKAGSDICGVGADGDIYLDAQDYSTDLTILKSGFTAREIAPGRILVKFKLFPQYRDKELQQERSHVFVMVQEDGKWLMDDILYGRRSLRQQVQEQNAYFRSL